LPETALRPETLARFTISRANLKSLETLEIIYQSRLWDFSRSKKLKRFGGLIDFYLDKFILNFSSNFSTYRPHPFFFFREERKLRGEGKKTENKMGNAIGRSTRLRTQGRVCTPFNYSLGIRQFSVLSLSHFSHNPWQKRVVCLPPPGLVVWRP